MFPKDVSEVFLVYILDVLQWKAKKFLIQTGRGAWAQVLQEYCVNVSMGQKDPVF